MPIKPELIIPEHDTTIRTLDEIASSFDTILPDTKIFDTFIRTINYREIFGPESRRTNDAYGLLSLASGADNGEFEIGFDYEKIIDNYTKYLEKISSIFLKSAWVDMMIRQKEGTLFGPGHITFPTA